MTRIAAGKFKNRCLQILDDVAHTRRPVVVTKHGRPVATLVPYVASKQATRSLAGSVLRETGDPFGTGVRWHLNRS